MRVLKYKRDSRVGITLSLIDSENDPKAEASDRHNLEDEISLRQFIRSPGQFDRLTRLCGVFACVGDL